MKEMVAGLPDSLYMEPGVGNWTFNLLGGVSGMLLTVDSPRGVLSILSSSSAVAVITCPSPS